MRPDQYKQKQSRRYKAKHGIRTVPKQDNRGRALIESEESRSNESKESVLPNDDEDFKPRKSYRRRQIGSNAFRYNENEATSDQEEDESHSERATKELLETIKNADFTSAADSYFQFRDERDWSNIIDGESTHELISIDFSRLEDLLFKLPLYERLDVSKEELTEDLLDPSIQTLEVTRCNLVPKQVKQSDDVVLKLRSPAMPSTSMTSNRISGASAKPNPQITKLDKSAPIMTSAEFSSRDGGAPDTLTPREMNPRSSQSKDDSKPKQPASSNTLAENPPPPINSSGNAKASEEDDLDFLLSLDGSKTTTLIAKSVQNKPPSSNVSSKSSRSENVSQKDAVSKETEDINDWLDDLLG